MLLLAACGGEGEDVSAVTVEYSDPLMTAALADQIMVDPDMINRNGAPTAASFLDQDGTIPRPDVGPDAIRAARDEAIALVGGTAAMRRAPQPDRVAGELPPEAALSVAARAASVGNDGRDCAAIAEFSAIWAARMPETFPVYPRGAVAEAAGTDANGCGLRVVNFATPVPLGEVMDFYFSRAQAAGFTIQRIMQDGDDILGGTREGASFMVFARSDGTGLTSVDLVTTN